MNDQRFGSVLKMNAQPDRCFLASTPNIDGLLAVLAIETFDPIDDADRR